MAKKKIVKKPVPQPLEQSLSPTSAPALPDHLQQELATHLKEDTAPAEPISSHDNEPADIVVETEDAETNAAVDEIVRHEGDELLHDADRENEAPGNPTKRGFWRSIGHFFASWWHNRWARDITLILLMLAVAVLAIIPATRYTILNFAGVRASSTVTVIDNTTRLPLKNVTVTIGNQKALTDSNGVAKLEKLTLGKQTMTIKRIAFAKISQSVTIGWGSNPQGEYILDATGVQYRIHVKDYVSDKPIVGAEATSGEAVAKSDDKGFITLTLEDVDTPTITATLTAPQYRNEQITITADTAATQTAILVASTRNIYFTRVNNIYTVESIFIDGKDRRTELAGTGHENKNVGLAVNDTGNQAAVVSTRDNVRDTDGFLLSTLTVLDFEKGTKQTVGRAEHIQLIDWIGPRLIFVETTSGASAANPNRYRLISYEFATNKRTQLASANQFNAILTASDRVYYAVGSTDPNAKAAFFRVQPDGTGRQIVFNQEVWTTLRNSFESMLLQSPDGWYSYALDGSIQKTVQPATFNSRRYVDGPEDKSAWVEIAPNRNILYAYDKITKKDTVVLERQGISYPLRWLAKDTIIYRVATDTEVADYVVSTQGGTPHKITNIINYYGFGN